MAIHKGTVEKMEMGQNVKKMNIKLESVLQTDNYIIVSVQRLESTGTQYFSVGRQRL